MGGPHDYRVNALRLRQAAHLCGHSSNTQIATGALPDKRLQTPYMSSQLLTTCFALFTGLLDVDAVALAGHSYGGATVTALCSQEPAFKCTVAFDPWW